jgi:hypothetical protein
VPLSAETLLLYSTCTWLAYSVSARYYGDIHYVWCTPNFAVASGTTPVAFPPSSSPRDIARKLNEDIARADGHSALIASNRSGIRNGAAAKRKAGVITEDQQAEIATIVDLAILQDFRPLVYVIPVTDELRRRVTEPAAASKAHPLADEFIITELPRALFDVIELYA